MAEGVPRRDEEIGLGGDGPFGQRLGQGFQRTTGRRSHREDPAAPGPSAVQTDLGEIVHHEAFPMHRVGLEGVGGDRPEGARADLELEVDPVDA